MKRAMAWLKTGRRGVVILLVLILLAGLLLRVFSIGHTLSYDEAWNSLSMMDAADGNTGPNTFYGNVSRHPPLYTGIGILFAKIGGGGRGVAVAMEILSLVFSLALIFVIYLCGREWFSETAGLTAAFLFAVMPAARTLDVMVKPESLTMLLGLLFLLFFFKGRPWVAGVFLGLSFMSKEIVVFVPAALFVFLLITRRFSEIKGFLKSALVTVLMAAWWYAFVSSSRGEFIGFFRGTTVEAASWREPWYYFLARIPVDVGWVTTILVLASLALGVAGWAVARRKGEAAVPDLQGDDKVLLLFMWVALTYLVLSFSYGKPMWLVYSALPALALLGGRGLQAALAWQPHKRFAPAVVTVVVALALLGSFFYGFGSYLIEGNSKYNSQLNDRRAAEYINARKRSGGRVMMKDHDLSPSFAFYLDYYRPGGIYTLPTDPAKHEHPDSRGSSILLLDDAPASEGHPLVTDGVAAMEYVRKLLPQYLLVRYRAGERPSGPGEVVNASLLLQLAKPSVIGGTWLFSGPALLKAPGD